MVGSLKRTPRNDTETHEGHRESSGVVLMRWGSQTGVQGGRLDGLCSSQSSVTHWDWGVGAQTKPPPVPAAQAQEEQQRHSNTPNQPPPTHLHTLAHTCTHRHTHTHMDEGTQGNTPAGPAAAGPAAGSCPAGAGPSGRACSGAGRRRCRAAGPAGCPCSAAAWLVRGGGGVGVGCGWGVGWLWSADVSSGCPNSSSRPTETQLHPTTPILCLSL